MKTPNNQSDAAIEVLRSWLDFCVKGPDDKKIESTIKFLEDISKYSYGEILRKVKIIGPTPWQASFFMVWLFSSGGWDREREYMSSHEEIMAVYEDDIAMKSYIVERKHGKGPFFNYFKEMQIRKNTDYDPAITKYQGEK